MKKETTRICRKCGDKFIGYGNTHYCLDCIYNDEGTKHPPNIIKLKIPIGEINMERKCLDCGKDISNRHHLAKWCVECSAKRKLEQDRISHKSPKIRVCKVCGKLIQEPRIQIHNECKEERQKQYQKKWYKKKRKELGITTRYHSHKGRLRDTYGVKVNDCLICGKKIKGRKRNSKYCLKCSVEVKMKKDRGYMKSKRQVNSYQNVMDRLGVGKQEADTFTIVVINNRTKETKTYKMVEGGLI